MKPICTFSDGTKLYFDTGRLDEWCVFIEPAGDRRYAPTDVAYFSRLEELGTIYGDTKIYGDFVRIYAITGKDIASDVIALIRTLAQDYLEHKLEIEKLFAILYAGMVAEENKQHAVLKKRIKRLGMHQTLILKLGPTVAANFSRGKKWKDLDVLCRQLGF